MKCYVIIISEKFPSTHLKAGMPTHFESQIKCANKIHTIRNNYKFWSKRIIEVQKGNAYISVRKWSGKPYNSPQVELFRFDKSNGVGYEAFNMHQMNGNQTSYQVNDGACGYSLNTIADNDGLWKTDFLNWFKMDKVDAYFDGIIIHFTDFRYKNEV